MVIDKQIIKRQSAPEKVGVNLINNYDSLTGKPTS